MDDRGERDSSDYARRWRERETPTQVERGEAAKPQFRQLLLSWLLWLLPSVLVAWAVFLPIQMWLVQADVLLRDQTLLVNTLAVAALGALLSAGVVAFRRRRAGRVSRRSP